MLSGIKTAAKSLGYHFFHTTYSIGSEAGFPDAHIIGHGKQFVFEFKGPRGKVSPAQERWIAAYRAVGVDARIIWPADYDTVISELMQAYEEAA
jgi:VRR-NUC domain.